MGLSEVGAGRCGLLPHTRLLESMKRKQQHAADATKICEGVAWVRCSEALHPLAAFRSLIQRGPAHSRCLPSCAPAVVRKAVHQPLSAKLWGAWFDSHEMSPHIFWQKSIAGSKLLLFVSSKKHRTSFKDDIVQTTVRFEPTTSGQVPIYYPTMPREHDKFTCRML